MEISNDGTSIYHRFQGVFLCNLDWKLLYLKGPHQSKIQEDWPTISQRCRNAAVEDEHSHLLPISTHIGQTNGDAVIIYVVRRRDNNALTGIVLDASGTGQAFEKFFARLILDRLDLAIRNPTASRLADRPTQITGQIVDLFDRRLRYSGKADQWAATGRSFFWDRIYHFTSQRARIELCLPAFPCKSSNTQKVTGKDPDRGEELALIRLHEFVDEVQQIYPYGAKIWIISDGHVFSDCIGVDDSDVDDYGQKLQDMNDAIAKGRGHTDQVVFMSLIDIFNLEESIARDQISSLGNLLQLAAVDHHIATNVTPVAEVCRQILMQGCQPQRTALRAKIDSQDASILALYRGFSRFMLEDLEMHPNARYLTRSKQKKLSVKISFEMIMRNQAYSNLVDMVLPNHVRLSIHAHNNAGPKFGIQLFDSRFVRAVESLSEDAAQNSRDLLHIPTPWHNCVIEVAGSNILRVTKSKIAREALASGQFGGQLLEGQQDGTGAFFKLHPRYEAEFETEKPAALTKMGLDTLTNTTSPPWCNNKSPANTKEVPLTLVWGMLFLDCRKIFEIPTLLSTWFLQTKSSLY